jgi:hypothetical protein
LKLLKIGAVLIRNTRRVRLPLSRRYPYQSIFRQVAQALGTEQIPRTTVPGTLTKNVGKEACVVTLKNRPSTPLNHPLHYFTDPFLRALMKSSGWGNARLFLNEPDPGFINQCFARAVPPNKISKQPRHFGEQ